MCVDMEKEHALIHTAQERKYCVALAEIALAILKDAPDTVWIGPGETVVERVFEVLGLEMEPSPENALKEFINETQIEKIEKLKAHLKTDEVPKGFVIRVEVDAEQIKKIVERDRIEAGYSGAEAGPSSEGS